MDVKEIHDWSRQQRDEANQSLASLQRQLSIHDTKINDCYHVLELCALSASDMVRVASTLRKELKARRKCKEDIAHTACMRDRVQSLVDVSGSLLGKSERRVVQYTNLAQESLERLRNDW